METVLRVRRAFFGGAIGLAIMLTSAGAICATSSQSPVVQAKARAEVRGIINRIAALPPGQDSAQDQQELFDQLVAMGPQAVPSIVDLMDDCRRLPVAALSLENKSPNAFESRRHYGPALMVDALSAVLNQLTGASFGSVYNSAYDQVSEADRRAVVSSWRAYSRGER